MFTGADVLQRLVYVKLKSSGLSIYDSVPENAPYPYGKIGEDSFKFDGSKNHSAFVANINIEIFSNYSGYKEVKNFSDMAISALENIKAMEDSFYIRFVAIDGIGFEEIVGDVRKAVIKATFRVAEI